MKLRLPSLLLSAIIALQLSSTAYADYIGNGVIYDVGKTAFSHDTLNNIQVPDDKGGTTIVNQHADSSYCWAAGASNIIQYWQDTYGAKLADNWTETPHETTQGYPNPEGTMYLDVYKYAYEHANPWNIQGKISYDNGTFASGYPSDLLNWYMRGGEIKNYDQTKVEVRSTSGFYKQLFGDNSAATEQSLGYGESDDYPTMWISTDQAPNFGAVLEPGGALETAWDTLTETAVSVFQQQGHALTVTINYGHILNCWGYEINADTERMDTLILTNMDDSQFGAFRVKIGVEMTETGVMDSYEGEDGETIDILYSYGYRLTLLTDDDQALSLRSAGGESIKSWLSGLTYINTPDTATVNGTEVNVKSIKDDVIEVKSSIAAGETLIANTRLTSDQSIKGEGITVGDGKTAIVMTASSSETLSMDGGKSNSAGMTVNNGGMVSLQNLQITNYGKDGIDSIGKTYLHDGSVSIQDNGGFGVKNSNYVEFMECETISISNNEEGGIMNTAGTVSFRDNQQVDFQNTANGKNDIYNASGARFNISDNDSVLFKGNADKEAAENVAVVNKGVMNMSAGAGKEITFQNTTLKTEGEGKTYIGQDISARSTDTAGAVHFTSTDGGNLSIRANTADGTYATLEGLTVHANAIANAGENVGTVTNAVVTAVGPLTMSNVALDDTDVIISQGADSITFSGVTIALTSKYYNQESNTLNLTGMFWGNFAFENDGVTFSLVGDEFDVIDLTNVTINLESVYADEQQAMQRIALVKAGNSVQVGQILLASEPLPEPTTGTLGLLALAGLCGRRRRR